LPKNSLLRDTIASLSPTALDITKVAKAVIEDINPKNKQRTLIYLPGEHFHCTSARKSSNNYSRIYFV